MKHLSIVIPAYNEADNICALIKEIKQLNLDYSYEIIVVDDASSDSTYNNALALKPVVPELRLIQHETTSGQSAAVATGIEYAEGKFIATMDGDGQNNPADIPGLLDTLMNSSNSKLRMVAGFRKKRNDPAWRIISSKIANSIRGFLLGDQTPDTGCGLKLFYRSAFLKLPFFDHMHRFLPALIQMQGGDVVSVEVSHRSRIHGVSKYGTLNRLWVGIIDIIGVSWLRLRSKKIEIRRCA
ncbi:MAG: glycosyltransferase family 2 protein [Desulfuromonadaceae bacterium]|nr:glycosyltransferase family 2 protein [Desulfuromonadaceae bacterium]MDD2854585.1 glycosyltransferase family 2 protein [Desulfuromonadaceae bacterium]